jgi:tight adherence protein C
MPSNLMITLVAFARASSLVLPVSTLVAGRRSRLETRLRDLASGGGGGHGGESVDVAVLARAALPKMGQTLVPTDEAERSKLVARLVHAGFYGRQAMPVFLGVKLILIVAPTLVGLAAGVVGLVTTQQGLIVGACLGIFGIIGPSFWLDMRKKARQTTFRRALPDALDVLVICLEGGLSLPGSLRKVGEELRTAHPVLALELSIVQREIQLGRSAGEALRQMGVRTDLEEIRSLASVIIQSE